MGTHPIFESDFDCLTETCQKSIFTYCTVEDEDTPQISDEFSAELGDLEIVGEATKPTDARGKLEVTVNGALVHTKAGGDGYVDSDAKIGKIFDAITAAL